jgi:hypothetical protein
MDPAKDPGRIDLIMDAHIQKDKSELQFHDLANAYPMMQGEEYEAFKAAIRQAGMIRQEVVLYEGKILDGRNRYRAGCELGIEVPTREFDPATEGDPALYVQNANDDRRHETQEVIRQRRAGRVQRVLDARRDGDSIRTIADKEGVSVGQVQRDLVKASTDGCEVYPPDTPESSQTVKGRDGKSYKAKSKPKLKLAAPPEREPGIEPEEEDGPTDAIGLPIPEDLLEVFAARTLFTEARKLHRDLTAKLNEIAHIEAVAAGRLRKDLSRRETNDGMVRWRFPGLESVKHLIDQWEPHVARCPWCLDEPQQSCKACHGAGWIPQCNWKLASKEDRERVEREMQK